VRPTPCDAAAVILPHPPYFLPAAAAAAADKEQRPAVQSLVLSLLHAASACLRPSLQPLRIFPRAHRSRRTAAAWGGAASAVAAAASVVNLLVFLPHTVAD